jgi:hypothetical protein
VPLPIIQPNFTKINRTLQAWLRGPSSKPLVHKDTLTVRSTSSFCDVQQRKGAKTDTQVINVKNPVTKKHRENNAMAAYCIEIIVKFWSARETVKTTSITRHGSHAIDNLIALLLWQNNNVFRPVSSKGNEFSWLIWLHSFKRNLGYQ